MSPNPIIYWIIKNIPNTDGKSRQVHSENPKPAIKHFFLAFPNGDIQEVWETY